MHISMEHVTKQFNGKIVLCDISLSIPQGEMLALLGPSGCGKTTLLNAIAGLVDIDGGRIEIDGTVYSSVGHTLQPEFRKIGMVFQDFALWPHMTVYENVAFGLRVKKVPRRDIADRVAHVLQTVRMTGFEKRYPHQLSGGQKQRVAIARALAPEPSVLLMDEPLSSLDAKLREEMRWQLMEIVRQTGVTTVYVTHDQVEALTMADRIVLLNQGKIEQAGKPTELYELPRTEFCASFVGASNLLHGTITQHMGTWAKVNCGGFETTGLVDDDTLSTAAVWMVRPTHIHIADDPSIQTGQGCSVKASIVQRAFQGDTWQYRVNLVDFPHLSLEVWHASAREIGDTISLWIPTDAARLVRPTAV